MDRVGVGVVTGGRVSPVPAAAASVVQGVPLLLQSDDRRHRVP